MIPAWQAWRALARDDRRLIAESTWQLLLARVCLALLPSHRVGRWLIADPPRPLPSPSQVTPPHRIAWALSAAARRLPFSVTCLTEALAARVMLRRRGYRPQLRLGVQPLEAGRNLKAHAWVECDGVPVVGRSQDLPDYVPLKEPVRR